jgi:hypothetical protein
MEFRWVAFITLWTILIGPIVGTPARTPPAPGVAKAARPACVALPPR